MPRASLVMRVIIALMAFLILVATGLLVAVLIIRRIPQQELAPDLFVLEGRGGNTTVLTTSEGSLVVDTKFWKFSERLRLAVDGLSSTPIRYVVNTSHAWEHTHGNLAFPTEAIYVSTANTRKHMLKLEPEFWSEPAAKAVLPSQTFEEIDHRIKLGGQLIHIVQVGRGNTDGDCVVYFPGQRVVATGDLFFNGYFPIVDHAAGGSVLDWITTLDRVLALGPSRIVPGHGPVTEPAELKAFQGYLRDLVSEVSKLRDAGKSRETVVKELRLPVHEARMKNLYSYSSLAQNAGDVYDELAQGGKVPERQVGVEALEGDPDELAGEAEKVIDPSPAAAAVAGEDAQPLVRPAE